MPETVREMIARLAAEAEQSDGWIEIDEEERGAHLVGGVLAVHGDAVEFEDDAGFRRVVPFRSIRGVASGRAGDGAAIAAARFAADAGAFDWRAAG